MSDVMTEADATAEVEEFVAQWRGKGVQAVEARRAEVIAEVGRLDAFDRPTAAQRSERLSAECELTALGVVRDEHESKLARMAAVRSAAQDPANVERTESDAGASARTSPPRSRERLESPAEVIARSGNPWRSEGGPLTHETGAGLISRAHTALEALDERMTHDGAEKLAGLLAVRSASLGIYEQRSPEQLHDAARMTLALSNPHYESAFRAVLRDPMGFQHGSGSLVWSDDERQAFAEVVACRTAMSLTLVNGGYLLPLVLDPSIVLTNAGAANPYRQVSGSRTTTSNLWEGVTSAGVNAAWLAEGTAAADASPTFGPITITPAKEAAWIFGSYEQIGDTNISIQVPALIADAFNRLEETAFATGTGTGQPAGTVTRATVDGSTGLVSLANAVSVFSLHQNLPARFRQGPSLAWIANVAIMDALRAVTAFAAATTSIVDDSGPVPRMFGIPFYESTSMDSVNTTGGHKNLQLGEYSQYLIVDRLGTEVIYEPLVKSGSPLTPTGQAGWFAYKRVGADVTTATAIRVHNNA
jgi:HK97 family phage major capsid protein